MALGPENTLAAFDLGMAAGADGLELDVRLSADGIPVVHHDERLERTTDGSGPIAARTAADLARLDAAYHFAVAGRFAFRGQDIGIPSLREVLHRYRDARIIVEMKVDDPALGHAVVREVRAADAIDRVCAAGYGVRAVRAVRDAEPTLATSATRPEVQRALRRTPNLGLVVDGIFGPLTEAAVEEFQQGASLPVDGIVGPQTWNALPDGGPMPLLQEGSTGRVVRSLQTVLTNGASGQWGTGPQGIDALQLPGIRLDRLVTHCDCSERRSPAEELPFGSQGPYTDRQRAISTAKAV